MTDPLPHLTPVRVLVDAETTWTGRVVGWAMMPPLAASDADVEAMARELWEADGEPDEFDTYRAELTAEVRVFLAALRERHPGGLHYIVEINGWPCEGRPYSCHTVAAERAEPC